MKNTKDTIQYSIDYLANLCLQTDNYNGYSDKDLMDATIIFNHILTDIIWAENKNLSKDKMFELATTTGMAIRELIRVSTGKDMHALAKKM